MHDKGNKHFRPFRLYSYCIKFIRELDSRNGRATAEVYMAAGRIGAALSEIIIGYDENISSSVCADIKNALTEILKENTEEGKKILVDVIKKQNPDEIGWSYNYIRALCFHSHRILTICRELHRVLAADKIEDKEVLRISSMLNRNINATLCDRPLFFVDDIPMDDFGLIRNALYSISTGNFGDARETLSKILDRYVLETVNALGCVDTPASFDEYIKRRDFQS